MAHIFGSVNVYWGQVDGPKVLFLGNGVEIEFLVYAIWMRYRPQNGHLGSIGHAMTRWPVTVSQP